MKTAILVTLLLLSGVCAHVESDEALRMMQEKTEDECDKGCERILLRVCGSNGVTYPNECLLEEAHCVNSSITLVSNGKCP